MAPLENLQRPTPYRILVENPQSGGLTMSPGGGLSPPPPSPRLATRLKGRPSFKIDGQLVQNKRIISNGFNKYFTSIAENTNQELYSSLDNNEATDNKVYFDKSEPGSMFLDPVMNMRSLKSSVI